MDQIKNSVKHLQDHFEEIKAKISSLHTDTSKGFKDVKIELKKIQNRQKLSKLQ